MRADEVKQWYVGDQPVIGVYKGEAQVWSSSGGCLIPATDPSGGFPGGSPCINLGFYLATAGSSSPHLVMLIGEGYELMPPFGEGSPTDYSDKQWLATTGTSSPHLRVDVGV